MIRVKAFSSRSRASEPATKRTVTNISVTVAAIAIAKALSEVEAPETTSFSTAIGLDTAPRSGSANSRFSSRGPANSVTSLERLPSAPGGSCFSTAVRISLASFRPRISIDRRGTAA